MSELTEKDFQANGYKNREDYLKCMADEYGGEISFP